MGLDMYLTKSNRAVEIGYWRKANAIHGYFEQTCANGELENCQEVIVTKKNIENLLSICKKVCAILDNAQVEEHVEQVGTKFVEGKYVPNYETVEVYDKETVEKVLELLPPREGFFFGNYKINIVYKEDILDTIEICEKVLSETDWDNEIIRYYAWW